MVECFLCAPLLVATAVGCSGSGRDEGTAAGSGGSGGEGGEGGSGGGSACIVEGDTLHATLGGMHVESNEDVEYNSNPPSSGPHCGVWGSWGVFSEEKPLSDCNFIHNLEHGGIVLAYRCPEGCEDIVSELETLRDSAMDPDCSVPRVIITPNDELDVVVAAAAWQRTWRGDCLDEPAVTSLKRFIAYNIGSRGIAPEATLCEPGSITP